MSARVLLALLLMAAPASADRIMVKNGSTLLQGASVSWRSRSTGWELWDTGKTPASEALRLLHEAGVTAEADAWVSTAVTPNDSLYGDQWGLHNTGQVSGTPDADIDAPEAWELWTGDQDVVVAILDTGINYNHPDLAPNIWTNPGEIPGNSVDDDANGYVDDVHGYNFYSGISEPMDDNGHGTHVAGIVGAVPNNVSGVAGVNWQVKLVAVKGLNALGNGGVGNMTQGIDYVIALKQSGVNVRIINNSWGGTTPSLSLEDHLAEATAAGILNVCAAGNNDRDLDCCAISPTCATGFYPAAFPDEGIISVGNSTRLDSRAPTSNFGAVKVDLFAPGTEVWSTWFAAPWYRTLTGTSMASPHVAGAAALLWGLDPTLTAAQVKQRIMDSTDKPPLLATSGLARLCVTDGRLNLYNLLVGLTNVETRTLPVPGEWYDVQGRRIRETKHSGVTFGSRKKVVIK